MKIDSGKNYSQEEMAELTTTMNDRIKALMEDEAFVEKMLNTEEPEDVQKLFAANGVELSIDEIKVLGQLLDRAAENGGELSEEDLEDVAGGVVEAIVATVAILAVAAATTGIAANAREIGRALRRFFSRW